MTCRKEYCTRYKDGYCDGDDEDCQETETPGSTEKTMKEIIDYIEYMQLVALNNTGDKHSNDSYILDTVKKHIMKYNGD